MHDLNGDGRDDLIFIHAKVDGVYLQIYFAGSFDQESREIEFVRTTVIKIIPFEGYQEEENTGQQEDFGTLFEYSTSYIEFISRFCFTVCLFVLIIISFLFPHFCFLLFPFALHVYILHLSADLSVSLSP